MLSTPRHGYGASLGVPGAHFHALSRTRNLLHHQHSDAVLAAARAVLHQKA